MTSPRPPRRPWRLRFALAACCACAGCALVQMNDANDQLAAGNDVRRAQLERERQENAALMSERTRLQDDLARRNMTADELSARLDELKRRNDAAAASDEQERQRRAERSRQLSEAQAQVKAISQQPSLSPEAKERQLEQTRQRVRLMLEQLLKT